MSARERVERETKITKEKQDSSSKNKTARSPKKSNSPNKKKGFGFFLQFRGFLLKFS